MRARIGLPDPQDAHISFIDHHFTASTPSSSDPIDVTTEDRAVILGVCAGFLPRFHQFKSTQDDIPHHLVETLVQAETHSERKRRHQAAAYARRHLQARPDHPSVLFLVVKHTGYRVLLSDANGVIASKFLKWQRGLDLLQAYLYSLYVPPVQHRLHDPTISWYHKSQSTDTEGTSSSASDPSSTPDASLPLWRFRFNAGLETEEVFTEGSLIFIGEAWSRRTSVFEALDEDGAPVVIKEYYRHNKRRFKEEDILARIHADGDVPGVVRLRAAEVVKVDGKPIQCGTEDGNDLREKVRLILRDGGEPLENAKCVNDILFCVFDTIEGTLIFSHIRTCSPRLQIGQSTPFLGCSPRNSSPGHEQVQPLNVPALGEEHWHEGDG